MDAQIRRRRTQDAVKRMLQRESLNQSVMMIFEDLHQIDDETQATAQLSRRLNWDLQEPDAA